MEAWPILNWKEWEKYSAALKTWVGKDWQLDRIVVPERLQFPDGFLRSEWSLRLSGRKNDAVLTFSLRPRELYLLFEPSVKIRAAAQATHSPFSNALNKWLKGSILMEVEHPHQERLVIFWFTHPDGQTKRLGLVLIMIPAHPEALLVEKDTGTKTHTVTVLASTKTPQPATWTCPDGADAPQTLKISGVVEKSLHDDWKTYHATVHRLLIAKAFDERRRVIEKFLKEKKLSTGKLLDKQKHTLQSSLDEPDWKMFGDYFSGVVHSPPPIQEIRDPNRPNAKSKFIRVISGFGDDVTIVCDPALSPKQQLEKFYSLAKRKKRREEESRTRAVALAQEVARIERISQNLTETKTVGLQEAFKVLDRIEAELGLLPSSAASSDKRIQASQTAWPGRSFISKDGMLIWLGRTKDENVELVSKYARGNDMWLHLRGRPSAHAVIPLPAGKSASLDALLDAAELVIFYSGGEHWGKTEVDYTYRKFVKKIKGSSEVSYTNNKTLSVEPDSERRQRLLGALNAQNV